MNKPYVAPPRGDAHFPAMYWDPKTKAGKVYKSAAEVPEGHLDAHPDDERARPHGAPAKPVAAVNPMSRDEIVLALAEGGIAFKKNSPTQALYNLLLESLRNVLTESGREFPADADAKALLELLPPAE